MSKKPQDRSASVVAKAGLWYTICNFIFRGMAFLTTPIFTRILSSAELGGFSNFTSWASILIVLTSFDFSQSVIRSKLEHEDDIDSYIWSLLSLSTLWTLLVYGVVLLFKDFFCNLMQIDPQYIHIMFLYLLTAPAYTMLITKHRAFYKYKLFILLTGIMAVSGTLLSLVMVLLMQNKLSGRIIGYYLPHILISAVIFVHLVIKGKKIKPKYWKYACIICLPLVPHVLSMYLLSSSDKILLTRFSGVEYTAIYSVAYSAYHIATILFDSMNKAWAPWLLECLHLNKYEATRKVSKIYIGIFLLLIFGVLLMGPEIILILGGRQYASAVYCLPPLIASCVFQLVYTMYVNIEFYEKKTIGVSIATIIATSINIILDLILLPHCGANGYIVAAYTTLAGYIVLFILHYCIVRHMKMDHVYDIKFVVGALLLALLAAGISTLLYDMAYIRYAVILVYGAAILYFAFKYKNQLIAMLKNRKHKKATAG